MLAHAEEIDADGIRQHAFLDHVADHLGIGQRRPIRIRGDVTERIQAEFDILCHGACIANPIVTDHAGPLTRHRFARSLRHNRSGGTPMTIGLRVLKRKRAVSQEIVAAFKTVPVANVSDCMSRMTAGGAPAAADAWRRRAVRPGADGEDPARRTI